MRTSFVNKPSSVLTYLTHYVALEEFAALFRESAEGAALMEQSVFMNRKERAL
jgi:hypothetical protein